MPITLRTRLVLDLLSKPLTPGGAHSIDLLNASKDPYRACSGDMEAEMDNSFPYPYEDRPIAEEYITFLSTVTEKFKEELKDSTKVKIESVRSLFREVPRYRAHVAELGTLTEASHEEYEDVTDYYQDLFNGEANSRRGIFVEVCHPEKRAWGNERYYPASILGDDSKKLALGKVRAYVEGFVGTRIPWRMASWHATPG